MKSFPELFAGLGRAYGQYALEAPIPGKTKRDGKATTVTGAVTTDLYQIHLDGVRGLGIVPIRDDQKCVFGALDVDDYSISPSKLNQRIQELNLPLVVCRSKSGGVHLYLFCNPTPAALVRQYLESVGTILGVYPCEIFPKQDELRAGDTGNWINLPYFNAVDTERYALDDDGSPIMDVDAFVEFANGKIVSDLAMPVLHDGPPCLQTLLAQSVSEGTRNTAMFNLGVYARKSCSDEWQERMEEFNQRHFSPFVKSSEMLDIFKSLERKRYAYTCDQEPLASVCSRSVCMRRKYGIKKDAVVASRDVLPSDAVVLPGGPQSITVAAREVFEKLTHDGEYVLRGEIVFHANYASGEVTMIDAEALRSRIETAGVQDGVRQTFSATTRGYKPEIASLSDCKGMLSTESANHLPRVRAISKCPVVLPDGAVKTWGIENEVLVLADDHNFQPVPVAQARTELLELLRDYQFRSAADRSRCVAALLTPLLRISGLIGGHAPITVLEADQSHAGKTKFANVIFAAYRDSNPETVVSKDASEGGVGGMTEAINDAYLHARNFVFLDNLRTDGAFANMFLESAVTNDGRVRIRVPYAGYKYVDVSRISAVLTANDLVLNRDLANRSNLIFIVKRPDNYKFHDWNGKSLEGHVRENRQHYFNCIASIVREWIVNHGCAASDKVVEHDFRPWASKMEYICTEVLGLDSPFSDYRAVQAAKVDTEAQWFETWCRAITEPDCVLEASKWACNSGISTKGIFESSNDLGLRTPSDTFIKLGFVLRKIAAGRDDFIVGSRYRVILRTRTKENGREQKVYFVEDIAAEEPAY